MFAKANSISDTKMKVSRNRHFPVAGQQLGRWLNRAKNTLLSKKALASKRRSRQIDRISIPHNPLSSEHSAAEEPLQITQHVHWETKSYPNCTCGNSFCKTATDQRQFEPLLTGLDWLHLFSRNTLMVSPVSAISLLPAPSAGFSAYSWQGRLKKTVAPAFALLRAPISPLCACTMDLQIDSPVPRARTRPP